MRNLEQCLTDGYSTGSTPGQGLGAIRRLSSVSDFYSVPGKGTLLLACWSPGPAAAEHPDSAPWLKIGAVSVPKRGEEVCGDSWGAEQTDEMSTILVADGLGHGYEAGLASQEAVRILREYADLTPIQLLERVHLALRSSRGAAVAVARIDRVRGKLTFCGVGNISAQIYAEARSPASIWFRLTERRDTRPSGSANSVIPGRRKWNAGSAFGWPDDGHRH